MLRGLCRASFTREGREGAKSGAAEDDANMSNERVMTLQEVLLDISNQPTTSWVYLPMDKNWTLGSNCAVLKSEEVPPELEDHPEAGVPDFAKQTGLVQALPVSVVQDIVANLLGQKADASPDELLAAFLYYYKQDAFIDLLR
jgi:hypothetical protein